MRRVLFFYFLPKALWAHVARETNRYRSQTLSAVVDEQLTENTARRARNPGIKEKTRQDVEAALDREAPFEAHEILHYIGLLISRVLCPHRQGLHKHWAEADGATPKGTWGSFMKRGRFEKLTRFLHFSDNAAPKPATRDRAEKIRPVLQVLEKTFRRGYRLGPRISFDEGMIPNRSRYNPIRVYMAAKPNKWGSKFFLTCCAETAYCAR